MLQNACPFSCTDDAADVLPSVVEVGQKIRQCLHSFCNHQFDVSELLTWSNFSCLTGCLVNGDHSKCGEKNNQTNIMAEVFSCIFTSSPTAQNQLAFTYKRYGGAITKLGDSNKTAHIFDPESWWDGDFILPRLLPSVKPKRNKLSMHQTRFWVRAALALLCNWTTHNFQHHGPGARLRRASLFWESINMQHDLHMLCTFPRRWPWLPVYIGGTEVSQQ